MNKLQLLQKKVPSATILLEKEMKSIHGGSGSGGGSGNFRCFCGMGETGFSFDLIASSEQAAINWIIDNCPGSIGGCFIP